MVELESLRVDILDRVIATVLHGIFMKTTLVL